MIRGVTKVGIEVEDQDRAKQFWTETMGFMLVQDSPYYDGVRWLEVQTPDQSVILMLGKRQGDAPVAPSSSLPTSNVFFSTDDLEETYDQLRARGVHFPQPPVEMFFGWWSIFEDCEGNRFALVPRGE
jgi:predicted enzyme related to lactoylglutathione lyase